MLSGKNWVEGKVIRQMFYRAAQIMHCLQTEGGWQPFICTGKPKNSHDSLYLYIRFNAVVWNETCNISSYAFSRKNEIKLRVRLIHMLTFILTVKDRKA